MLVVRSIPWRCYVPVSLSLSRTPCHCPCPCQCFALFSVCVRVRECAVVQQLFRKRSSPRSVGPVGPSSAVRCCSLPVVRRSPFVVRRSSFIVHRSSFIVRRSSFDVRRSSFVVRRSSSAARLPPCYSNTSSSRLVGISNSDSWCVVLESQL
jgi:hypothetical protein